MILPPPAYITSAPHLSGYRVTLGYRTLAEAQDAHSFLATTASSVGTEKPSGFGVNNENHEALREKVISALETARAKKNSGRSFLDQAGLSPQESADAILAALQSGGEGG